MYWKYIQQKHHMKKQNPLSGWILIHGIPSLDCSTIFNSCCALMWEFAYTKFRNLMIKIHPLNGMCLIIDWYVSISMVEVKGHIKDWIITITFMFALFSDANVEYVWWRHIIAISNHSHMLDMIFDLHYGHWSYIPNLRCEMPISQNITLNQLSNQPNLLLYITIYMCDKALLFLADYSLLERLRQ